MKSATPRPPSWIETLPRRPLCDVPWFGRSVVGSEGAVNFCCFSSAVVGNVNEQPLPAIWRGAQMQAIRRTLAAGAFPVECQSTSCPLFRADARSFLNERIDGALAFEPAQLAARRAELAGSRIEAVAERFVAGDRLRIDLVALSTGARVAVDVFAAVTLPGGELRFLPGLEDFPLPLRMQFGASADSGPVRQELVDVVVTPAMPLGGYELCVALVLANKNPAVTANCLWWQWQRFALRAPAAKAAEHGER